MTDDTTTTDRFDFRPTGAFAPVLDAQRLAIESTRRMTRGTIQAQADAVGAVADAVEAGQDLAERNNEFSRELWHTYLEAVEASLPEGAADFEEFHRTVDEGHDAYFDSESEAVEAFLDALAESEGAYEEFAHTYADTVDSSFEAVLESLAEFEGAVEEGGVEVEVTGPGAESDPEEE